MKLRVLLPSLLASAVYTPFAQPQEAISDAALRGTWFVGGSEFREAFTFSGEGEFVHSYIVTKKGAKDIPTVEKEFEGAYKLASPACSVGAAKGNLWIVKDSDRCCFNAYLIGKTLVLDEIRGPVVLPPGDLCNSKTLKRDSQRTGK